MPKEPHRTSAHTSQPKVETLWLELQAALTPVLTRFPAAHPIVLQLLWRYVETRSATKKSSGKAGARRRRRKLLSLLRSLCLPRRGPSTHMDVLVYSGDSGTNYREACALVSESLSRQRPECSIGHFDESGLPGVSLKPPLPRLRHVLDNIFPACSAAKQLQDALADSPVACAAIPTSRIRDTLLLLFIFAKVAAYRDWLLDTHCRAILTANEQRGEAMYLVTAARSLGIYTGQLLHGIPSPLYWPFLSNETFTWGPLTSRLFEDLGAPSDRLREAGALEASYWLRKRARESTDNSPPAEDNGRLCVFLAQWHGSDFWNTDGFHHPIATLGKALQAQPDWKVLIRLHPKDPPTAVTEIRKHFGPLAHRVSFSSGDKSLLEDLAGAHLACTVSSTGILLPLLLDIPSVLIVPEREEDLPTKPFLPPDLVVRSERQLIGLMRDPPRNPERLREVCRDLLGDIPHAPDKVASRILENLRPPPFLRGD